MGNTASTSCLCLREDDVVNSSQESLDPLVNSRSSSKGQLHLMWKKGRPPSSSSSAGMEERFQDQHVHLPTRLVIRKSPNNTTTEHHHEHQPVSTHIYAVRKMEEQRPYEPELTMETPPEEKEHHLVLSPAELFTPAAMAPTPSMTIPDWVVVSEELNIFVVDSGLTPSECNSLVALTEQVCRGQYAAYTYAKQTLGCRDFLPLAQACFPAVHRVTHAIQNNQSPKLPLRLDEREPHVVKYDISKKERQKLDMHTDKSEWTFLISLSDGCGLDYEGGGTFFESLEATIHVQRGHALVFPGKLRHCGQRISKGVRFLLVGFLVDANAPPAAVGGNNNVGGVTTTTTTTSGGGGVVPSSSNATTTMTLTGNQVAT